MAKLQLEQKTAPDKKHAEILGFGYKNTDKKLYNVMWKRTLKAPLDLPHKSKTNQQSQTTSSLSTTS